MIEQLKEQVTSKEDLNKNASMVLDIKQILENINARLVMLEGKNTNV